MRGARLARAGLEGSGLRREAGEEAADLKRRFNRDFWVEEERVLRAGARRRRQPGRRAHVEQRPPALERDRRQVEGQGRSSGISWGRGSSPAGACARWPRARAATTRSATTSARSGRSTTRSSPGACGATASRRRRRAIAAGILDAAEFFDGRLPEAFGGYERELTKYPVQYPTACSPQAWSTGAPLLAAADDARASSRIGDHLVVDPALPMSIGHLELLDIPGRWGRIDAFGRGRIDVENKRRGGATRRKGPA